VHCTAFSKDLLAIFMSWFLPCILMTRHA
jgi:hypothetical protein